jgi:F-type H+-transporting ATPase subunit gamma
MATLREVRARIGGVKKTQKITKAMKMVAAAKLRRAQTNVVSARPYARKIRELLQHLSVAVGVLDHALIRPREVKAVALVVVTADRGLCGAFNANLVKTAVGRINTEYADLYSRGKVKVFCVGKKGLDYFARRNYPIAGKYVGVYNNLVFAQAQSIAGEIVGGYVKGDFDRVDLVYNEFKSVSQQRIVTEQFLPIPAEAIEETGSVKKPLLTNYIYEPSRQEIIGALVPRHLHFQIWRVVLESNAAEQGARMAAMENATENANELISVLQLQYNKARQASITKELLEVVSGANALKRTG